MDRHLMILGWSCCILDHFSAYFRTAYHFTRMHSTPFAIIRILSPCMFFTFVTTQGADLLVSSHPQTARKLWGFKVWSNTATPWLKRNSCGLMTVLQCSAYNWRWNPCESNSAGIHQGSRNGWEITLYLRSYVRDQMQDRVCFAYSTLLYSVLTWAILYGIIWWDAKSMPVEDGDSFKRLHSNIF